MNRVILFILMAGLTGIVHADPKMHSEEAFVDARLRDEDLTQSGFAALMNVMDEATQIATKTKLNADFVPGMVTVLYGQDLEAKGINHVHEALELVAGVHGSFANPVVRGVDKWASGKVKFLLNGTPINHAVTADPTPPMYLPVQLIDRIEIMRGPGSAVYGEYAFLGVINIITRSEGSRIYSHYGSYGTYAGGGFLTHSNPESDITFRAHLSGFTTAGERVTSGEDILYTPAFNQPDISYAPGPSSNRTRQRTALLSWNHPLWSLEARYLDSGTGDGFGITDALPPPDNRLIWQEGMWGIKGVRHLKLWPNLDSSLYLGWSEYTMDMDRLTFFPPGNARVPFGFVSIDPITNGFLFHPDGVVGSNHARERRLEGGLETLWNGLEQHQMRMSLEWASMKLLNTWTEANVNPLTLEPTPWHRTPSQQSWIQEGVTRSVVGLVMQDQWSLSEPLDLTYGVRFDHYDDVGMAMAPRIGLVYRLTQNHILKAQYGRAFRPPTFMEMYSRNFVISGNPEMRPETINSHEIGYIYREPELVFRATLFHAHLNNLISGDPSTGKFENFPGADLQGVELEGEYALNEYMKLTANLSHVATEDLLTGQELEYSANWLGNVGLLLQPWSDYTWSLRYRYIGPRNRAPGDTRNELAANHTVHLTATIQDFWEKNLQLRASVDNLFNTAVVEPAGANLPLDYPRPGRTWGLTLSYHY
ncbi:MAG: TonB-dependent receptor [Magnetococcales bacterium]|nr:TonB-dependent receptor [Magnetococcales bacterium]